MLLLTLVGEGDGADAGLVGGGRADATGLLWGTGGGARVPTHAKDEVSYCAGYQHAMYWRQNRYEEELGRIIS